MCYRCGVANDEYTRNIYGYSPGSKNLITNLYNFLCLTKTNKLYPSLKILLYYHPIAKFIPDNTSRDKPDNMINYIFRRYWTLYQLPFLNIPQFIDIRSWSNPAWYLLHYISLRDCQSDEFLRSYIEFVTILSTLLPCEKCKVHLQEYLYITPPTRPLFEWSVTLHDHITSIIHKVSVKTNPTEAREYYSN